MEKLGVRALHAGMYWASGMVNTYGAVVACAYSTPGDKPYYVSWAVDGDHITDLEDVDGAVPNLNHAGTVGVLLAQVRERWDDEHAYARFRPGMLELESVGAWACYAAGTVYSGDSEAEALVRALEAAP